MPGISFIYDLNGNLKQKESEILHSLKSMLHNERYKYKVLFHENSYFLGYTKYKEYPITSFENDEFYIYLEGQIYGKDHQTLNTELNDLAKNIFHNQDNGNEQVAEWLLNTDGDFIIFILHKYSHRISLINDAFGRLPLYYYNSDGKLLISRQVQFVSDLINNQQFDRMGIAQYLLFGYTTGKRTLLNNIYYLEPGTLIKINFNSSEIKINNVHQFNFEVKKYSDRKIEENAIELVLLFCRACKDRAKSFNKNVLGLSGGLDSRAVAAALCKTGIPFSAATRLRFDKSEKKDVEIARKLASELKLDWKLFNCDQPKGKDFLKLLIMKDGLNFLGMSFILSFFDKIRETYGPKITYFTGDGGDRLKPTLKPLKRLKNLDDLVNYIISTNNIFSFNDVITLTNIPKNEIIDEIKNLILSYPERDLYQKYVHFMIYESAFKWVFEGEDRNRFYFWSVTPFYSIHFFNYVMNCPDSMKTKYKLYRKFLIKLSTQASAIENASWNLPITSKKIELYLFAYFIYKNLPSRLKKVVKSKFKKKNINSYESNPKIMNCFWEQIENCKSIYNYLSIKDIKEIKNMSKKGFYNLITITSTIEKFECKESTFEKYYESELI